MTAEPVNGFPVLISTLRCPGCGHERLEIMPTNSCQYFYDCTACGALLRPLEGDCCVYCSYGDIPCPPTQEAQRDGAAGTC